MERIEINGVKIYPFTSKDELISYVDANKGILVAINAGKINRATPQTREIINTNIGYADGLGAVAALKKKGIKDACKLAGCEIWLDIISKYYKDKIFYLIGGTDGIIETTVAKLKKDFPGIRIAGYRNGFFKTREETDATINDVVEKKPDVVFVAMGSPRQELLMGEMYKQHPAIYQGLGGSFKVYCGFDKRAPEWFVRHNLEGPFRFLSNLNRRESYFRFFNDLYFFLKLYTNQIK